MPIVLAAHYAIPMTVVFFIAQVLLLGRNATFVFLKAAQGYVLTLWLFLTDLYTNGGSSKFLETCIYIIIRRPLH